MPRFVHLVLESFDDQDPPKIQKYTHILDFDRSREWRQNLVVIEDIEGASENAITKTR
jgi:hypothetical protein